MEIPDVTPLKPLISNASRKAQSTGSEVLVSHAQPVEPLDLVQLFASAAEHTSDRWFWEDPTANRSMLSLGSLTGITPPRNVRFQEVARNLRQFASSATVAVENGAESAAPVFQVAFSYDPRRDQDRLVWQGFPSTYLQVPRLTILRDGDEFTLIQNTFISPAMDIETVYSSVFEFTSAIFTSAGAVVESELVVDIAEPDKSNENEIRGFVRAISKAEAAIHNDGIDVLNVARRQKITTNGIYREARILNALRDQLPGSSLVAVGRHGSTFLGYSEVPLLRNTSGNLCTEVSVGSTRRGQSDDLDRALAEQLRNSPLDSDHHEFCVDHVFESFEGSCSEINAPDEPDVQTRDDRHVFHSRVTGMLNEGKSPVDVLAELHPPVHVSGYPTQQSLEFLRGNEEFDRGWFSAPVGWIDLKGDAGFICSSHAAAIRAPVMHQQRAYLFTVATVYSGADPDELISLTDQELAALRNALQS